MTAKRPTGYGKRVAWTGKKKKRKKQPHHMEVVITWTSEKSILCPMCKLEVRVAGKLVSYHAAKNGCTWDGPVATTSRGTARSPRT